MDRYTSIIITSYIPDYIRSKIFRTSLDTLLKTTKPYPVEIIVVDNGGDMTLSAELLDYVEYGEINCYIRNHTNMHFGYARNQGLAMAKGNYIVIADNDLHYNEGWLEACWKPLEVYPDRRLYSTPIEYPTGFYKERYDQGKLDVDGVEYNLNMRAGSNCFMIKRADLEGIGRFENHRIAGTKWTDKAVGLKYLAAVAPGRLVYDLGLRYGYNHREPIAIKRVLRDGREVFYNQDEFRHRNGGLHYSQ